MIKIKVKTKQEREYFYIGCYKGKEEQIILKIGRTNNLERREKEHKRGMSKLKRSPGTAYRTLWNINLSQSYVSRVEDRVREELKKEEGLKFIAKDRFEVVGEIKDLEIEVRKKYVVPLRELL